MRDRGHFLNCILSCAFLLNFLLSLVALINHLGGWSSVLSDGKPVRKGADFSEPRWDRVLGAEAGQVLGQRRVLVLSCDCRLYGSGVFTNKTLLHGKHVVHARVSSLLQHLLLSFQMSLAGYESQLIFFHVLLKDTLPHFIVVSDIKSIDQSRFGPTLDLTSALDLLANFE